RNDAISAEDLASLNPSHIIVGPGPGSPDNPNDVGICFEVVQFAVQKHRALLGVCLGQQLLVKACGGMVLPTPEPMHGKTSVINLERPPLAYPSLFSGIEQNDLEVMRYHSLMCDRSTCHADLVRTAFAVHQHRTGGSIEIDMAL